MPSLENETIRSGVTSRSRRRRNKQVVVSDCDRKENIRHCDDTKKHPVINNASYANLQKQRAEESTRTKPGRRRKPAPIALSKNESKLAAKSWRYSLCESDVQCSRNFRSAIDKIALEFATPLKKDATTLVQSIVKTSLSMSNNCEDEEASLFLKVKSPELLTCFRKIIKAVADEEIQDCGAILNCLYVAVHGLRALVVINYDMATNEAIMRLLYHTINRASLTLMAVMENKTDAEPGNIIILQERSGLICVGAFEALKMLLLRIKIAPKKNNQMKGHITFEFFEEEPTAKDQMQIFPVPMLVTGSSKASASITISQVFTICIESILSTAHCLSLLHASKKGALSSFVDILFEQNSGEEASIISSFHSSVIFLLRSAGQRWISFMSRHGNEVDLKREVLPICKRSHKILWEMASKVGSCNECLELRRHAILVLLGYGSRVFNSHGCHKTLSIYKVIGEKHFDNACTLAWKASVKYVQQKSSAKKGTAALEVFHAEVGGAIDGIAELFFDNPGSQPYVQYCAYRALQVGLLKTNEKLKSCCIRHHKMSSGSPCMFKEMPFQFVHKESIDSVAAQGTHREENPFSLTLALCFLSIQIQNRLEALHDSAKDTTVIPIEYGNIEELIYVFCSTLIDGERVSLSPEVQNECLKLLIVVPLHSSIFKILNGESLEVLGNEQMETLAIAGNILVNCVGPLAYRCLLNGGKSNVKNEAFTWDIVIESYGRSALLYDCLHSNCGVKKPHYLQLSDSAMRKLLEILTSEDGCRQASNKTKYFEKAITIFAAIGKRRVNRKEPEHSLMPLLHSISLTIGGTKPEKDGCSYTSSSQGNLSSRWATLASVLQSVDLVDEASLATAAALKCVVDSTVSNNDFEADLVSIVQFLGSKTHGFLFSRRKYEEADQKKTLIRRLLSNFVERGGELYSCKTKRTGKFSMTSCVSVLTSAVSSRSRKHLADIYAKETGQKFNLVEIMTTTLKGRTSTSISDLSNQTKLLVTSLDIFGQLLQRKLTRDKEEGVDCLEAYERLVQVLVGHFDMIPCDSIAVTLSLRALAYIVASCSLLSRSPNTEFLLLGNEVTFSLESRNSLLLSAAENFARKASAEVSEECTCGDEWKAIYSLVRIAAYELRQNIAFFTSMKPIRLDDIDNLFELVSNGLAEKSSYDCHADRPLVKFWKDCMTTMLSRLRDRLAFHGENLLALQVAVWHNSIFVESDRGELLWVQALTANLLLSGGTAQVSPNIEHSTIEEISGDNAMHIASLKTWCILAEMGILTSNLRWQLRSSFPVDTDGIMDRLNKMLSELNSSDGRTDSATIKIVNCWLKSSIFFALAEASSFSGHVRKSISYCRICFQNCQNTVLSIEDVGTSELADNSSATPWWLGNLLRSVMISAREKQVECLRYTALLYAQCGDHRKSEAYSISAVENSEFIPKSIKLKSRCKLDDILCCIRTQEAHSAQEQASGRLLLWSKGKATAYDFVVDKFRDKPNDFGTLFPSTKERKTLLGKQAARTREIEDLLLIGNLLYGSPGLSEANSFSEWYKRASELYSAVISGISRKTLNFMTPESNNESSLTPLSYQLRLGEIRSLVENSPMIQSDDTRSRILTLCQDLAKGSTVPNECRAWAFYYLGLLDVSLARQSGALQRIWDGHSNFEETYHQGKSLFTDHLDRARKSFLSALTFVSSSELLTRLALRSLALVTGPEKEGQLSTNSACLLIHTSIGGAARQSICRTLANPEKEGLGEPEKPRNDGTCEACCSIRDLLEAFDCPFANSVERDQQLKNFFLKLSSLVPHCWDLKAIALCPTGEILTTKLEVDITYPLGFRAETVCIFPPQQQHQQPGLADNSTYDSILKPLDSLIMKSEQQLGGLMNYSETAEKFQDDGAKRAWWEERKTLDDDLRYLIESVEREFFGSACVQRVLFGCGNGNHCDERSFDSSSTGSSTLDLRGNLTSKFDALVNSIDSTNSPSNKQFSADRCFDNENVGTPDENTGGACECSILILDENFNRFPFEGMPSFANQAICRLPALSFALGALLSSSFSKKVPKSTLLPTVNPKGTSYIVDPEANLSGTRERLVPYIRELTTRRGWKWEGVIGEVPDNQFIENSLARQNGLMIYCGHGGGQRCFSRSQIENLTNRKLIQANVHSNHFERACQSSVILMGCSSAKLESINRKGTRSFENLPIFYEPEGIALSYLVAGAPCVVGNLWDVTDHDIDRYCVDLLERFLGSTDGKCSLPSAVAEARNACKMAYINGCAPVCYGLPVQLLD